MDWPRDFSTWLMPRIASAVSAEIRMTMPGHRHYWYTLPRIADGRVLPQDVNEQLLVGGFHPSERRVRVHGRLHPVACRVPGDGVALEIAFRTVVGAERDSRLVFALAAAEPGQFRVDGADTDENQAILPGAGRVRDPVGDGNAGGGGSALQFGDEVPVRDVLRPVPKFPFRRVQVHLRDLVERGLHFPHAGHLHGGLTLCHRCPLSTVPRMSRSGRRPVRPGTGRGCRCEWTGSR